MLAGKMDKMLEKQDETIEAIDRSKDELVTEIRSLRGGLEDIYGKQVCENRA